MPDGATEFKCAPPIRDHENREALWRGLKDGVIDFVVSDHSPCTPALKGRERGDFSEAWGGIASLQLGLPAVWTEASRRGHSLSDISAWMSARPAALAGLAPAQRAASPPGFDADLVVWDPEAEIRGRAPSSSTFATRSRPIWAAVSWAASRRRFSGASWFTMGAVIRPARSGAPILGRDTRA